MNNGIDKLHATEITARQETLFAVGFAIHQRIGCNITPRDILDEQLFKEAYDLYVKSDKIWLHTYELAEDKSHWVDSVVASVNKLRKHPYLRSGKFTIFRGMDIMEKIYKKKGDLIKKDDNIPKINNDKWNPGDVWLLRKGSINKIPKFKSLDEYNLWIKYNLIAGRLVSVSLKQSSNPRVFYISKNANIKIYTFGGVKSQESPFNTGITLLLNGKHGISNKTLGIRSFDINYGDFGSPITSELDIRGSEARHGKSSLSDIIITYNIPMTKPAAIQKNKETENVKYIGELYNKLFSPNIAYKKLLTDWDNRKNKGKEIKNYTGFFKSIIHSLEFGIYLKNKPDIADEIVMKLVRDASSQGYWSSDFLKIM